MQGSKKTKENYEWIDYNESTWARTQDLPSNSFASTSKTSQPFVRQYCLYIENIDNGMTTKFNYCHF